MGNPLSSAQTIVAMDSQPDCSVECNSELSNVQRPSEDHEPGEVLAMSRYDVAGGDGSHGWLTNQSLAGRQFGNDVGSSEKSGNVDGLSLCPCSDAFPRKPSEHQQVVNYRNRRLAQPPQISYDLAVGERVKWIKKVYGSKRKAIDCRTGVCHDSQAYLKRQAKQKEIAKTNRELMKRLVNAKPSVSTFWET